MDYSIKAYIGKEVRRFSFLIKHGDDYYNLFTLIETVLPDMQDYEAFPPKSGEPFCEFTKKSSSSQDSVCLSVDRVILTEEMLVRPWDEMVIDGTVIKSDTDNYQWKQDNIEKSVIVPLHDESDRRNELVDMLPKRQCAAYINYCILAKLPQDGVIASVLSNKKLVKRIEELSTRLLGFDLSLHSKYMGAFVFATYNPIFRSLEFTEDAEKPGIYCRINYRPSHREPLTFRVKAYNEEHLVFGKYEQTNNNCSFLIHIAMDEKFHSLDIEVYDKEDVLIDFYEDITFIHGIALDMNVAEKEVVYQDEKGKERTIVKYSNAFNRQIGTEDIKSLFGTSEEYSYDKFEKSLDFVFFDGDREHKRENHEKAKNCVLRILNSTRKICYIGDIYFNKTTFMEYITPIERLDLDIRILSSREKLKTDERDELKIAIENHNTNVGTRIKCRLMQGTAALHDRVIVSDDRVWMLGCSLNEFGNRATTLIRVPQAYASKIISTVEKWWNSDNLTEDL